MENALLLDLIKMIDPTNQVLVAKVMPMIQEGVDERIPDWRQKVPKYCYEVIPETWRTIPGWEMLVFFFSRDALKAVRPENLAFYMDSLSKEKKISWYLWSRSGFGHGQSEELAEFGAILGAHHSLRKDAY